MRLSWGDCCRHHEETSHAHFHFVRIPGAGGLWECEDCQELEQARDLKMLDVAMRRMLERRRGRAG